MEFKFENLIVWQKAMDLGDGIHKLSDLFPKREMYNLSSQIRRAADSITLNTCLPARQVAEGSIGQTNPGFKKFIGYAIRPLAETITCLHKAKRRRYLSEAELDQYYKDAFNLMNMLVAFRTKIN